MHGFGRWYAWFLGLTVMWGANAGLACAGEPVEMLDETHVQRAQTMGAFSWSSETGLWLRTVTMRTNHFWVASGQGGRDGILRATLRLGKRPDGSVMFRARFPERLDEVDGYSVSFERNRVVMHRWEGGYAAPVTQEVKMKPVPAEVRLEVKMSGPHVEARVWNAKNDMEVAHLVMDDAASVGGTGLGYRVHKKQDSKSSLRTLSFEPSDVETGLAREVSSDPDAYLRQHPWNYVAVPRERGKKTPGPSGCSAVRDTVIPQYDLYRCAHDAMMGLVDARRRLPAGWFWSEPRAAFTDSEFRRAARDLDCAVPMHCDKQARLNPNRSAKDADMIQAYLDAYLPVCRRRISHVRIETLGRTYLGHEMRAIVLSNADPARPVPRVMFNGAHHGIELLASDMAFDVLEQLCESEDEDARARYDAVLRDAEIWILPTVNLDGVDLFFHVSNHLGRKNGRGVFQPWPQDSAQMAWPGKVGARVARTSAYYRYRPNRVAVGAGVDINRNYPLKWGATGEVSSSSRPRDYWYRGSAPASEPEIQSMMNAFHVQQFVSSISFHTVSTKILSPYSIDALANPPHDQDVAWQLALKMAEAAGVQVNGKPYEVVKNLYSVDGTDQDWFRMMAGTTAYLIEGPLHNPTGEKRTQALATTRPAWEVFLEAARRATVVRVRDTEGNPVVAAVEYSDIPRLNGEVWTTRPQDGTHAMLCSGPRTVTVAFADGRTVVKKAKCPQNRVEVIDVVFDGETRAPSPLRAWKTFGVDASLVGVDARCDLERGYMPHLPALRYCRILGQCVDAGMTMHIAGVRWTCRPGENPYGWTMVQE